MTRWMARKGARRIILASRSSTVSEGVQNLIKDLADEGTEVLVQQCDVSRQEDVKRLASAPTGGRPIRGVIHSAMVLHVSTARDDVGAADCMASNIGYRMSCLKR